MLSMSIIKPTSGSTGHDSSSNLGKGRDIVILRCNICLHADPTQGVPLYELVTDDIGSVHISRDGPNGIRLVVEDDE